MDDQVISSPSVSSEIDNDSCVISGSFTRDSAAELADLINAGQIPFSLKQVELRSVGPQLGADAMRTSLIAGLIGIALVMLFMLIVYRIPGLVASIALCFYMVIEALIFSLVRVNLSLPGIAGIILSIGMAVDANVIIFERVKEELKNGKTVKSAIDSGFKRAFTAILDSNITTLIACAVLFFLGTGTIVGFATTLGIGVIVSMFTALTVTHFLLNRMLTSASAIRRLTACATARQASSASLSSRTSRSSAVFPHFSLSPVWLPSFFCRSARTCST